MPDHAPRVLFLAGDFEPDRDGVADYTARLATSLRRRGVDALIAARPGTSVAARGEPVVPIVGGWSPAAAIRLGIQVRRLGPDVVHVQAAPATFGRRAILRWLPLALRVGGWLGPLVVTLHEHTPARETALPSRWAFRRGLWDPDLGFLIPSADAIIVTSARARDDLAASPVFAPRVRLIPLPPNLEPAREPPSPAVRAALRDELGFPADAAIVAFFGFIHPVKRLTDLLIAVAQVRSRHPELHLLVVGGWDPLSLTPAEASAQQSGIEALVAQLELRGAVRFAGHVASDRASALLSVADLAALPMSYGVAAKSGSLLALLAHGLPTVATAPPDGDAELEPGAGVVSVPPRDPAAIATAIERLLDDPVLRRRLSLAARRFGGGHGWEATTAAHEVLYASLLGRPAPSTATGGSGVAGVAR